MKQPYYITTAIAYTSGKPHIGNIYEIVLADSMARYHRLLGHDVYFQTGTDEHGQKIEQAALKQGIKPQAYVDKVANQIQTLFDQINISYDRFMRTTDPSHVKQVQKIFKQLYEQGDIYKGEYVGLYCTACEAFWTSAQLVDGKCPDCGGPVHFAKEEAYFFKLSKYEQQLKDYIATHPEFIQPESRKNEMLNNFINPGLQDLCVSRTSFKWGIPVDFDPNHVVYVWIDALSNYITSLGYDVSGEQGELFKKYWPAQVHLIGKDILRFHTIYWPIMLMALKVELPKQVFGHPWLLIGDRKMSKSTGNTIYSDDLIRYFGVDAIRYFVLHEMPYANDGSLTWELVIERTNSDLVNILGNLLNRTLAMANKYFAGKVVNKNVASEYDQGLLAIAIKTPTIVEKHMHDFKVAEAISAIFDLLKRANKYIDETAPWQLAKDSEKQAQLATVLYNLLEVLRISAILLTPFIPETSAKILAQLQTSESSYASILTFGKRPQFEVTSTPVVLYQRIDEEKVLAEIEAEFSPAETKPTLPLITYDQFMASELVVGTVLKSEKHPKAKKILISQIDLGSRVVQVVSGIAEHIAPADFVGQKVIIVANLAPATIYGTNSEAMILAGINEDYLEVLTAKNLPNGTRIK